MNLNEIDINLINTYLKEGNSVPEVIKILGMPRDDYREKIRELKYKYSQKERQYVPKEEDNASIVNDEVCVTSDIEECDNSNNTQSNTPCTTSSTTGADLESNTLCNTVSNTKNNTLSNTLSNTNIESINFVTENIETLMEMITYYKRNKECNTNNNGIVIDLIDDSAIDKGNPVSVRINRHVYNDWKEFTSTKSYSSKELISMALKEYMEKYK